MNELNLIAPISETGYGLAAFNIIKALSKKIKVNLHLLLKEMKLIIQMQVSQKKAKMI